MDAIDEKTSEDLVGGGAAYDDEDDDAAGRANVSYQRFIKRHASAPGKMVREQRRQQAREQRKVAARESAEKRMAELEAEARAALEAADSEAVSPEVDAVARKARLRKLIMDNRDNWREKVKGSMLDIDDVVQLEKEAEEIEKEERAAEAERAREQEAAQARADAEAAAAGHDGLAGEEAQAGEAEAEDYRPPDGYSRQRRMSTDAMIQRDISTLSTTDLLARAQHVLEQKKAAEEEDRRESLLTNEYQNLTAQARAKEDEDARSAEREDRGYCATCNTSSCVIS